ncbi:MAG TPA: efflux RND transporter periplasmic adaptor subunit [Flavobacteriaceae bacterium]|nr:efflux RND transporter periplasmic adaptor subunit [Flavobacteriaceae bacterium]
MKNIFLFFLSVIFLSTIATSCSGKKEKSKTELVAVPVKVAEVSLGEQGKKITASGSIEAANSANVSTRMMGYITGIYVKMGQRVQKGQLLATLNSTDLTAKKGQANSGVLQAQSAYKNAKKDYDRFLVLFEQNSITQKEMDDMTTHFEMAKAGLDMAIEMRNEVNAQFAYTNITAPFSGVVTGTFAKEGDMASPGMPLIGLEGSEKLEARIIVSERDIAFIHPEMKVDVTVKSLNRTLVGKVSEISHSSRNSGGQYFVKIELPTDQIDLFPGMYVNVVLTAIHTSPESVSTTILIPTDAVIRQGQLSGIYVVTDNDTAILRWLRLGKTFGDQIEVLSGLISGEKYITSFEGRLLNGSKVIIQ